MTTIIIQARLGSTRLPGKTLKPLGNGTVLDSVVERCKKTGWGVVVAIPWGEPELKDYCESHGYPCFEGHPTDLTNRYLECARAWDSNPIVRITADCPFISTDIINLCLAAFKKGYLGFHALSGLNVEVFDRKTLIKASKNGPDEHCTTWMRRQKWAKDLPSLELNTKKDYRRLKKLCDV